MGKRNVMTLDKKDYTPVPGFFDLRNFELTAHEFRIAWRTQLLLRSVQDKRDYYKSRAQHSWDQAKHISCELQRFLFSRLKPGKDLT